MLVQQILKSKPSGDVQTIEPQARISEAVAILSSRKIGALVVSSDGGKHAIGILSERDVVREMTRKLITCAQTDTALGVLEVMTEGRFRHLPVVENGQMVGLISIGDVVKARLAELAMEKDALEGMIMGH
jgi:CBS domain-containing protein